MLNLYLSCFLLGLGLSVLSFVSGLDRVHVFGHGHHHGTHHHHGPRRAVSPFNAAAMTAFLAWFGGTGVVLHQMTAWAEGGIAAAAVASGLLGGKTINRFLRGLMASEKPLEATTLIGKIARVTSSIREGGTGEIVFVINGTRKVSAARSEDGAAIGKGEEVVIISTANGVAYVSTWESLSAITQES
jgi:hypothetical protein